MIINSNCQKRVYNAFHTVCIVALNVESVLRMKELYEKCDSRVSVESTSYIVRYEALNKRLKLIYKQNTERPQYQQPC